MERSKIRKRQGVAKKLKPGKKQVPGKDDKAFLEGLMRRREELEEEWKDANKHLELLKKGMSRLHTLLCSLSDEVYLIEDNIAEVDSQIAELDSPKRG